MLPKALFVRKPRVANRRSVTMKKRDNEKACPAPGTRGGAYERNCGGIHMKKWKIALAAVCVCFLFTVAYAAGAGGVDDPLVTKSYLDGPFLEQVRSLVDRTVEERKAELEEALEPDSGYVFKVVTLSKGQTLEGDVGCEVMLRIGSAVCGSPESVGLIDTTGGTVLEDGEALVTNHLYMVTISTRTVTAVSGTVKVLARGPYTVS